MRKTPGGVLGSVRLAQSAYGLIRTAHSTTFERAVFASQSPYVPAQTSVTVRTIKTIHRFKHPAVIQKHPLDLLKPHSLIANPFPRQGGLCMGDRNQVRRFLFPHKPGPFLPGHTVDRVELCKLLIGQFWAVIIVG
jgi:hypothetical protein